MSREHDMGDLSPEELCGVLASREQPMQAAFIAALAHMELDLTERGWDQLPALFAMHREMDGETETIEGGRTHIGFGLMVVELSVPLPPSEEHIARALHRLAIKMRERTPEHGAMGAYGWVVSNEAWYVDSKGLTDEEIAELHDKIRAGEADPNDTHREVRLLQGVDVAGVHYLVARLRDRGVYARVYSEGKPEGFRLDDTACVALCELMEASA